jgi:two-component system cell cycle response regulator
MLFVDDASKKKTVLLLRWLPLIALAYWIITANELVELVSAETALIGLWLVSNLVLVFVPVRIFAHQNFDYLLVVMDTTLVTWGISLSGQASAETYLVFFLIIIITAFSRDLMTTVRNTVTVSLLYGAYLWQIYAAQLFTNEGLLLRFLLLFVVALFYGFLAEQAKVREQMARKVQEVLQEITATTDLQELLYCIVHKVAEVIAVQRCSIVMIEPGQDQAYIVATTEDPRVTRLEIDLNRYPEIRAALRSGQMVMVEDVQKDPLMAQAREVLEQLGCRSALVLPLIFHEVVVGTLLLWTIRNRKGFAPGEVAFCQAVANASSNAIRTAQLLETTREQAMRDQLTGLYNRRFFAEQLRIGIEEYRRTHKPFTVLLLDLDQFKQINDSAGHHAGDVALREVAAIIQRSIRTVDIAARYGGDEFVCLLTDAGQEAGEIVANRILEGARRAGASWGLLTISIGLATFPDHCEHVEDLLPAADRAMYAAKSRGGNRVCLAQAVRFRATCAGPSPFGSQPD